MHTVIEMQMQRSWDFTGLPNQQSLINTSALNDVKVNARTKDGSHVHARLTVFLILVCSNISPSGRNLGQVAIAC